MAIIDNLPNEVLERILLFLPGATIPELMFVSKQFKDVISSSVKLMENFEVQWTKNKELDMRPLLKSVRKYRKLQILEVTGLKPNLLRFITNHGPTLTSIYLYECSMTTTELQKIVSLVADNLKEFNMCEVNIEKDHEVSNCKLPNLNMMELMYGRGDGYVSILPLFTDSRINRFQYEDDYEMNSSEIKNFSDFLVNQSELKLLSLTCNVTQQLFSDSSFASAATFQAEQIFLWMNGPTYTNGLVAGDPTYDNVIDFLETQRDSLKILTLGRCDFRQSMVSRLLKLQMKELRIVQCQFIWDQVLSITNQSVEKIFISMHESIDAASERALSNIMKCCTNVKSMKFACVEVSFELSMAIAYHMKNLKKLNLFRCDLLPITYPTLQNLQIAHCHLQEVVQLLRVNRQLLTLRVPNSYNIIPSFHEALGETSIKHVQYD